MNNLWKETGGQQMHYTKQDDLYLKHLSEQLPNFSGGRVLEMGPGEGGFALKLNNEFKINEYYVLDLEVNIFDSVNFLKESGFNNIKYCFSKDYKTLFGEFFDLFVANVVVTEVGKEYREDLLSHILPHTRNAMIIGQFQDEKYKKWIFDLFNNNFDVVKKELTQYKNCYALTGEKND